MRGELAMWTLHSNERIGLWVVSKPQILASGLCVELAFAMPKTLAQKLWDAHVVRVAPGEPDLLYVDLHLVHEVTSPQAFEGLRVAGRRVRRPDLSLATMDHNVPTQGGVRAADESSRRQMELLAENCRREGIPLYQIGSRRQGIVHVIGPELGLTQPGMLIVCATPGVARTIFSIRVITSSVRSRLAPSGSIAFTTR